MIRISVDKIAAMRISPDSGNEWWTVAEALQR
jgi:hypothetical protein